MATEVRSERAGAPSLVLAAEVALAAVTIATVAGLWRLFVDGSFVVPLVAHAVLAHAAAAFCRRRGLGAATSVLLCGVAAFLAITWGHLGSTTALGVPTAETFREAGERLEEAWRTFGDVKAPAPVMPGFVLTLAAALWAIAWLADLAAFRLWTSFEALIPSGTLFVFASLFAADRARGGAAAAWVAAALGFVLVHRVARQHGSPSWLGSDPRLGTSSLLRVGGALTAVAVAAGWALGPNLPGADAEALVAVSDLDDDGSRQTISPLVEIQPRLIEQSNLEMFTVVSEARAYWRLTSLDIFDGEVFASQGSFDDEDGELGGLDDPAPGSAEVTQQYQITGMSTIWLPAAFEPRAVETGDAEVLWEPSSSTLIVPSDVDSSDGLNYEVVSAVPAFRPEQLTGVGDPPDRVADRALGLPADFPERVRTEAAAIMAAAGATTPYAQALALQNYFRDPGRFMYDLHVEPGHSDSAIETFLFETRRGYCEQFAGTYAAMARAVGLPARVAVGFTPGESDPSQPGRYIVRGENAHAWPEVWIPGAGWVAFEPTPGRGAPNATEYTGVPEAQDTPGDSTEPQVVEVPDQQLPAPGGEGGPTTTVPTPGPTDVPEPAPLDGAGADGDGGWRWVPWVLLGVAGVVVLLALAAAAIAGLRWARRWRRRATSRTPEAKVRCAWADTVDAVGVVGLVPRRDETPVEFAGRAAKALVDTRPTPLAWSVERADYSAEPVGDEEAVRALELADGIRHAIRGSTTTRARVLAAVDPRPPARRGRARGPRPTGPRIQIRAGRQTR